MFNNCCDRQDMYQNYMDPNMMNQNFTEQPIMEQGVTNCVQRDFVHQVPHICPVHTHIINRHIYNHTYTPQYTCSEECQVINNDQGGCCGF